VDDAELMTIGHFARLTGLSVGTLRHYDEVGCSAVRDPSGNWIWLYQA
jgi:DNA-binding transcriptional MerR regulator